MSQGRSCPEETRGVRSVYSQPIANSWLRQEVSWAPGIRLQFSSQFPGIHSEVMCPLEIPGAPYFLQQFSLRDQSPGMPDERS